MPTPSLFPIFLKAQAGGGSGVGTIFIETLEVAVLDPIDVDVPVTVIDVDVEDFD